MSRLFGFVFAACLLAFATSISVLAANPDWPKSLTLATASPGGVFYVYGEAVAKILTESLKIDVNPLPTQGSEHNVKLVESGGAQLAFSPWALGSRAGTAPAIGREVNTIAKCGHYFRCMTRHSNSSHCDDQVSRRLLSSTIETSAPGRAPLVKATAAASDTLPQNAVKNTFLPFHPGAVRYYREVGIKIPDALVPTN